MAIRFFFIIEGIKETEWFQWDLKFDLKLGRWIQNQIGSSRQRGFCLVYIVDQIQNFQGMFQVLCYIFILINKEEGSQNNQETKSFRFFLLIAVLLMLS